MGPQCCWCHDMKLGVAATTSDELKGKLPTPWWCYLNDSLCLPLGGGWCVCLARHAPFTGASHGKSLWASIPPRVSVYLHNPQVTLYRPSQTVLLETGDESIPDKGDSRGTKRGWRPTQSSCLTEAIPDIITMLWSSQSGSCFVTTTEYVWVNNVCVCAGECYLCIWVTVSLCVSRHLDTCVCITAFCMSWDKPNKT